MAKMGGMSGLMAMMPGVAKIKSQLAERNLDDSVLKRQMAIIDSMTPGERKHPDILKASRKKRIAAGAGTKVEEINKLLKMHRTMADLMKAMGGGKARGPMAGLAQMMGLGGGMPSPEDMAKLAQNMPGGLPGAGGLPPNIPGLPPTNPGGGSGLPGLPGLGKFPGLGGGGGGKLPTPGGLPPDFFKKK
jgi:signal recognition particle subunit SRP54